MIISILLNITGHSSDLLETILLTVLAGQELIVWIVPRMFFRARFSYPIDLDLMQSRWGTWVMIVVRAVCAQYVNFDCLAYIHLFIHSFSHSFIHSFIHSFTYIFYTV